MSKNLISSPPSIYQLYLRKLGAFGSSIFGNDLYFLKEFVDLGIQDFGEERVIEMLKNDNSPNSKRCKEIAENWEDVKRDFRIFDIRLTRAKGFYDKIEKKDFSKINDKDVEEFMGYSKRISFIKEDIYTLAVFLIRNSPLQKQTIPSDAWKVLEHSGLKKLESGNKTPQPLNTESSGGEN
jgi:hypothetical protein